MNGTNEQVGKLSQTDEVHRLRQMFLQSPSFAALLQGPEHRFVLANPAYQQLIGHRDVVGQTVRKAIPEAAPQGFIKLLDSVFSTGEAYVGKDVKAAPRGQQPRRHCEVTNCSRSTEIRATH